MLPEPRKDCSTEGCDPAPKPKRKLNTYVITMIKVVELWDVMIGKLDPQDKKFLANRCKYLVEKHGLNETEILSAVTNYGRSEWHISTGAWKKPLAFLTSDNIRKWQKTAEEQNVDRLNNLAKGRSVPQQGSLQRILERYKLTHHHCNED